MGRVFQNGWSLLAMVLIGLFLASDALGLRSTTPITPLWTWLFLALGPLACLMAIRRGARRGLVIIGLLSWGMAAALIIGGIRPLPSLTGYLSALSLWVLGRHGRWLYLVPGLLFPLAWLYALIQSIGVGGDAGLALLALLFPFLLLASSSLKNVPMRWVISLIIIFGQSWALGAHPPLFWASLLDNIVLVGLTRRLITLLSLIVLGGFGVIELLGQHVGLGSPAWTLLSPLRPPVATLWVMVPWTLAYLLLVIISAWQVKRSASPWTQYLGISVLAALLAGLGEVSLIAHARIDLWIILGLGLASISASEAGETWWPSRLFYPPGEV